MPKTLKQGYSQPASQLPGTSTYVTETSKENLPSNTSKKTEDNYESRSVTPEHKEVALPIPPGHPEGRDKRQLDKPNQPSFNGPPASKDSPESKPLHERTRSLAKPGEEYGTPYIDQGTILNQRRTMTALELEAGYQSPGGVFPTKRQHKQKGLSKLKSKQEYRHTRVKKLTEAKRRYKKIRRNPRYKKYKDMLEGHPDRFKRLKAASLRVASLYLASLTTTADFYREQEHPENLDQTWKRKQDKGTPDGANQHAEIPDGLTSWVDYGPNQRGQHTPAQTGPDYYVDNNPGSAKVIPEGHDFANKMAIRIAFRHLEAKKLPEILKPTAETILQKGSKLSAKLTKVDKANHIWFFDVAGSEPKPYRVKIQAAPQGKSQLVSKADLFITCSCDFWQYQGPEYHAKQEGYLYGKPRGTAEAPDKKDPDGKNKLCKHAVACLNKVQTYDIPMGKQASSVEFLAYQYLLAQED